MNKGRFNTLNKPWKEVLYSFAGFGPNLLMVLMGAYFSNAVNTSATGDPLQTITGTCLVLPLVFPILWAISKCFDGIIDVPLASLTDGLRTKWGNRRIPIAIAFAPMVIAFAFCWWPINTSQTGFTIWVFIWSLIFFASYTMCLIAYYGSLSTVCVTEKQKARVSSYKSVFDTISYALVYALVPVLLQALNIHIHILVYALLPLMLTMVIPLFMIKEGQKWEAKAIAQGYDITPLKSNKPVKFFQSVKTSFRNKPFVKWLLINSCCFFGLQIFLCSMNALITMGMGLNGTQMTILNTFAFGPVPFMLYLFNKIKNAKGTRFALKISLSSFAIAILAFFFGGRFFWGNNLMPKMIIGAAGGIIGSFAIGSFFMMSYLVPSQISTIEEKLTRQNHASMYFACQVVTTSIVGAVSSGLIWEYIKNLFIAKGVAGVVTASGLEAASVALNVPVEQVFNLGTILVPFITCMFCLIGFILCFFMPKNFDMENIGLQFTTKENLAQIQATNITKHKPFEFASVFVYDVLWLLSCTLFGFAWYASVISSVNAFSVKKNSHWWILFILLFFPLSSYLAYKLNKQIDEECDKLLIKKKSCSILVAVCAFCYLNCISLSIMQHKLNKIVRSGKL